jgi:hypothetical protein
VDEIELFEELQPPPPPDAPRIREAARARLTAATSAPPARSARSARSARRRHTVVTAAATALVAVGTAYGLVAVHADSPHAAGAAHVDSPRGTAAGLTTVQGCPGMYLTAGTLERVNGTQLIIQPAIARPVTVATSSSTAVTIPAGGTVSDITDGSQVIVQGTPSGQTLAATEVGIRAALPAPSSFAPVPPEAGNTRELHPGAIPAVAIGTVANSRDGSFTVVMPAPTDLQIQVITSNSTKVVTTASASLTQLSPGANALAVGQIGSNGVLTASTVAESSPGNGALIAGGPVRLRTSSCSASAITSAAILAGA